MATNGGAGAGASGQGGPDVTVVVAVYNTMPYVTECLQSLVTQTIGLDRMEIIAVDDGSTDGSGAELDRFAAAYPGTVKVLRQANSGGPASPSNRALDVATGRYVFFVGSDDYLGSEALERLVRGADETGSDIMLGRLVGANGRNVFQAVYARNRTDIDLLNSSLPWAMSNTKLFRRSLIEDNGIRYPEDLPTGSDQPFTLRAVLKARRISVLADYKFYYAVRRTDASNITYRTTPAGFVSTTGAIMDHVAELIPPGDLRDTVLRRHFTWELGKQLQKDFLNLDRESQADVKDGIRKLADTYLTDNLRRGLDVGKRIPLSIAQYGDLDDLIAVIEHHAQRGLNPLVTDGQHCYVAMPGFRDSRRSFPDEWFDISGGSTKSIFKLDAAAATWATSPDGGRALVLSIRSAVSDLPQLCDPPLRVRSGDVNGAVIGAAPDGTGTVMRVGFHVSDLIAHAKAKSVRPVTAVISTCGRSDQVPVRAKHLMGAQRRLLRRGMNLFVIKPVIDHRGRLAIATTPVTARRIVGRIKRVLR